MKIQRYATTGALACATLVAAVALAPAFAAPDLFGNDPYPDNDIFYYLRTELDYAPEEEVFGWEIDGWAGSDYHRLRLISEGERSDDEIEEAAVQLRYSRYLAPFWNIEAGIRQDFEPTELTYGVIGISGLAPYRFETDAALFVSEEGDVSGRLEAEIPLLITQRLILEPFVELELFAQDVPELGIESGATGLEAGLQLRYEIIREFAPYVALSHERLLGDTADRAEAEGEGTTETLVKVGLRMWF